MYRCMNSLEYQVGRRFSVIRRQQYFMLLISIIMISIDKAGRFRIMKSMSTPDTAVIADSISKYIDMVRTARSEHTTQTYANALSVFSRVLKERWKDPETTPTEK